MSLIEKIQADLTAAMKEKDELRLSVLRMVKAALKNKEIEKMRPLEELRAAYMRRTFTRVLVWCVAIAALCLHVSRSRSAWAQDPAAAKQMIDKARELVSYSLMGPFEMRADLKLASSKGNEIGSYLLDWAAPDKFREEIHIRGYDQVKIASGTTMYVKRNLNYTPLKAFWVEELMEQERLLTEFQRTAAKAAATAEVPAGKKPGTPETQSPIVIERGKEPCVSVSASYYSRLCVDEKHNWANSISLRNISDSETIQYADYRSFGSMPVPQHREYIDGGRTLAAANVKHVAKVANFPADTFTPASDAERLDWCYDQVPATRSPFKQPTGVNADDFQDSEILDVFVNADGTVSRIRIIGSSGLNADSAIRKLANDIRFTPAACGGKPVPSEEALDISAWDLDSTAAQDLSGIPEIDKSGYTKPQCLYCPTPSYSEAALQDRIQGAVVLELIILPNGRAGPIRVIKPLGYGLDASAVRTVRSEWRFKPALAPDGKPAPVRMMIEIDFHLY